MVKERKILIFGAGNMAKEYMKVISLYEYKVVIISLFTFILIMFSEDFAGVESNKLKNMNLNNFIIS